MLPIFSATSVAALNANDLTSTEFPAEFPTDKELADWLDVILPSLRAQYGAVMRGQTPAHLVQFENGADDLTGFTVLADGTAGMHAGQVQQHNRRVTEATAARDSRAASLAQGLRDIKDQLAQVLVASLRPNAPLRLKRLLVTHQIAPPPNACHDGAAMIAALIALKGTTTMIKETQDHDREVERMRDEALPDGCHSKDYADKVHRLIKDHVDHLERPFVGEALGKFIIRLMPAANASEGRDLIRRMLAAGTLTNTDEVIRECTVIVHESSRPGTVTVSAAVRARAAAAASAILGTQSQAARDTVARARAASACAAAGSAKRAAGAGDKGRTPKLPTGEWCGDGTCTVKHVDKSGNYTPCFRAPWRTLAELPEPLRSNRAALERFNKDKQYNVEVRKVCTKDKLVLYPLPPLTITAPAKTAPAKSAAPYDKNVGLNDEMDGLVEHSLRSTDLFYLPAAPVVPLSQPSESAMEDDLQALDESFAGTACYEDNDPDCLQCDADLDIFERPLPTTLYPLPAVAIGADNLDVPTWWANPGKAITMDITIVRLDVTALRPEMRRREIREVLRRHPIVLGFVSPDTGGPSSRTKLDIIAEARTTVGLPPLTHQQIGSWTPSTKSPTLMVLPVEIIVPPPGPLLDESDTDHEAPMEGILEHNSKITL
jgi:hypothetical protein